ncbi:hypothetical protein PFICI_05854 [Pestalotiopsis fici W106-1]|uniref:CorA-like transporter domain-containing protein n=1 Tax=Pestalotiopsis fici (strain W106-1 / CGMCC3.15140) TaxID=1229662 RepID=W3XD05_PESFW|nr:uncharacterized protein PFICI_05854 [Pestalotiopsis fici W106-1]ETS83978.1 hypothetical protein PFICI_05854 [Pestalotiopsis fici W106-1]
MSELKVDFTGPLSKYLAKPETLDVLTTYLTKTSDPLWRFIFLQSRSSRSPLGCTREQLAMLLTHHQVMPSFLDLVMAFSPSSKPPTHAMFKHENYLEKDSPRFAVPGLGRSGRQIQCAFNLLSVEATDAPNEGNPWPLRQTALCHTFDVVSGQTLFIVLKADTNILKRIHQEALNNPEMQPSLFTNVEKSFAATLLVQLIIVEWCAENWADYIEYFETKVRDKSIEGKMAPISAATTSMAIEMDLSRRSTTTSPAASRKGTFPRQTTFGRDSRPPTRMLTQIDTDTPETPRAVDESQPASPVMPRSPPRRRTSSLRQSVAGMFTRASSSQSKNEDIEMGHRNSHEDELVEYDLDEKLSFEEFQRMNRWGSELEQSIMVIGQNLGVLEQLQKHYREIIESHEYQQHIRASDLTSRIATFFKRIDGVSRDLVVHRDRLEAVARTLENDKAMYGAALQYESARVSKHFAVTARESADRMEDWTRQMHSIAIKTEHETVSMHVITIFTLIFLPGTFVATFFSSGAIQWDEDGTLGTDYIARPGGMKLFFITIVPLTVVIMIIWGLIYWVARRHRKAKNGDMVLIEEKTQ